mmetsp:Transcript_109541/g.285507  ORF Transcript_109541/g.285507 Transcript_109541/m.285507 type:complete len:253 (+) Transcript_109541:223-981(+)
MRNSRPPSRQHPLVATNCGAALAARPLLCTRESEPAAGARPRCSEQAGDCHARVNSGAPSGTSEEGKRIETSSRGAQEAGHRSTTPIQRPPGLDSVQASDVLEIGQRQRGNWTELVNSVVLGLGWHWLLKNELYGTRGSHQELKHPNGVALDIVDCDQHVAALDHLVGVRLVPPLKVTILDSPDHQVSPVYGMADVEAELVGRILLELDREDARRWLGRRAFTISGKDSRCRDLLRLCGRRLSAIAHRDFFR